MHGQQNVKKKKKSPNTLPVFTIKAYQILVPCRLTVNNLLCIIPQRVTSQKNWHFINTEVTSSNLFLSSFPTTVRRTNYEYQCMPGAIWHRPN